MFHELQQYVDTHE
ncbi:hypothetical protein D043_4043A, partial [Vibrio parahaemolyticus EKP-021]